MLRNSIVCACLVAAAACAPRALVRNDGAYRPDGASYRIAQLSDGTLMPSSWRIGNYDERDGVLRVKERSDVRDLVLNRIVDDGVLTVFTAELSRKQHEMTLRDLVNEQLASFRTPYWDRRNFSPGLRFEWVREPYKEAISGCEAVDMVLDERPQGTATTTRRVYLLWMRP